MTSEDLGEPHKMARHMNCDYSKDRLNLMFASLDESKNSLVLRLLPLNVQLELKMVSLMLDMLE